MTVTTTGDTRILIQQFLDAHSRGDAGAIGKPSAGRAAGRRTR